MNRRLRAGRNDEREETERAVFGAVERVLPDAAAHPALQIRLTVFLRQPVVGGEQPAECGSQRVDALPVSAISAVSGVSSTSARISGMSTRKPKSRWS